MIHRVAWVMLIAGVLVQPTVSRAQVTPSPTNSLTTAVGIAPSPLGGTQYNITDGTRPGGGPNLFHSFGGFSIGSNDIANFSNTRGPGIVNVLGRVTGGRSNISGLIQTSNFDITPPNLYLINPAGIMFGPGASVLNVSSFHVSTANYVRFPDAVLPDGTKVEVKFLATDSPLPSNGLNGPIINSLTANPIAFGFLGPNPVRIAIDGSSLQVSPGQTLSVVSGDAPFQGESQAGLRIAGPPQFTPDGIPLPTLGALGGRIRIVSVASPGEVPIDSLDVASFARLGQIDVTQTALIDASGDPGGAVVIRGNRLTIDGSSVFSVTGETTGTSPGIDVQLTGDAVLSGGGLLLTATQGTGRAGDVVVSANRVEITGGASIQSLTIAGGRGGDVQVSAWPVRIDGFPSAISTSTLGSGRAGDIALDVESLTLTAGAKLGSSSSLTFDGLSLDGAGGDVRVHARGAVTISGVDPFALVPSGIASGTSTGGAGGRILIDASSLTLDQTGTILSASDGTGDGGAINIDVGLLRATGGATINTTSVGAPAGNVGMTVNDLAEISGAGSGLLSSSSFGRSGDLALDAGRITVAEGARIQSGSVFAGQGGNIALAGRDSITISGRSGVSS
jgi:filamentous hemagglutinin family protein